MYKNILTSLDSDILTITINRESKLNALNRETLKELHLAFTDAFKNEQVGGIILTGAGTKAFAAGADIQELSELDKVGGLKLAMDGQSQVFNLIEQGQKPVIAAINGLALGGGLELALACHIRIVSEHAKLGLPEVTLGLIPGYGGTQRLPRLIGKARALELILTGDMIEADLAYELGLVNHFVPADFVLSSAVVLLQKILSRSPLAVAAAIRAVNAGFQDTGFGTEIEEFSNCFETADFKEGTNAFLEKRASVFKNNAL